MNRVQPISSNLIPTPMLLLSILLACAPLSAEDGAQPVPETFFEEILVTASKRTENVQDLPFSVVGNGRWNMRLRFDGRWLDRGELDELLESVSESYNAADDSLNASDPSA